MNFHYSLHGRVGEKEKFNAKVWTKKIFLPSSGDFFFLLFFLLISFVFVVMLRMFPFLSLTHAFMYYTFDVFSVLSLFLFFFLVIMPVLLSNESHSFLLLLFVFTPFDLLLKRKFFKVELYCVPIWYSSSHVLLIFFFFYINS